jgi:hypothetical protein
MGGGNCEIKLVSSVGETGVQEGDKYHELYMKEWVGINEQ